MTHKVEFWIDKNTYMGGADALWRCDAEVGATCRAVCSVMCYAAQDGAACDCATKDNGECGHIVWMQNQDPGWDETYIGGREMLRSGVVELIWTGEGFDWRYSKSDSGVVQ